MRTMQGWARHNGVTVTLQGWTRNDGDMDTTPLAIEQRRWARLRAAWDRHSGPALTTTALIVAIAAITVGTLLYR